MTWVYCISRQEKQVISRTSVNLEEITLQASRLQSQNLLGRFSTPPCTLGNYPIQLHTHNSLIITCMSLDQSGYSTQPSISQK